jgi:hypothetical protein
VQLLAGRDRCGSFKFCGISKVTPSRLQPAEVLDGAHNALECCEQHEQVEMAGGSTCGRDADGQHSRAAPSAPTAAARLNNFVAAGTVPDCLVGPIVWLAVSAGVVTCWLCQWLLLGPAKVNNAIKNVDGRKSMRGTGATSDS